MMNTILQMQNTALENDANAMFGGMVFIFLFIGAILFYIFYSYCYYKIFQKANREDAWGAFIPIYNTYILIDTVKKPWWWLLIIMFVPIVNFVFAIMLKDRLSRFFGKDIGYTLGLIFLPFIFIPILAFGGAKYNPEALTDDRI